MQFLDCDEIIRLRLVSRLWNGAAQRYLNLELQKVQAQIFQSQKQCEAADRLKSHASSLKLIKRMANQRARFDYQEIKYLESAPPKAFLAVLQAHYMLQHNTLKQC